MKNGLLDMVKPFQILGYDFWFIQCPDYILKVCQQDPSKKTQYLHNHIFI